MYVEAGDVWRWDVDRTAPVRLTFSGDVESADLAPDGEQILFRRAASPTDTSLWLIRVDGSGRRRILTADQIAQMHSAPPEITNILSYAIVLAWIPGTSLIAYSSDVVVDQSNGIYTTMPSNLWLVDLDSGARKEIVPPREGGEGFRVSPDGLTIAVPSSDSLKLVDVQTSTVTDILLWTSVGCSHYLMAATMQWTENGSLLLVSPHNGNQGCGAVDQATLYAIQPGGPEPAALGTFPWYFGDVQLLPGGEFVIYKSQPTNDSPYMLADLTGEYAVLWPIDGSLARSVALDWLPDGRHMIFEHNSSLVVGNLCGETHVVVESLPEGSGARHLQVLDETRVIYQLIQSTADSWQIGGRYLISLDGSIQPLGTWRVFDYAILPVGD